MNDFVPSASNRDSYFLNFSDGMPMFGDGTFDYYGDEALQHTKRQVKEIIKKGISKIKNGGYEYLITNQLIKDGRKNLVLNKKINAKIPVTLFHGSKDEAVPVIFSKKLIKIFNNANKKLNIIKNGDHSLFAKKYQLKIIKELKSIISQY